MKRKWLKMLYPLMQADGGAGAGGGTGDGGTGGAGGGNGSGADDGGGGTGAGGDTQNTGLTPEQVRKLIADERQKWEAEQAEQRKRDQMTAEEKLKAEKEDAERKAREATEQANKRLVTAEAKVQAAALGVKPERIAHVLKLANLDSVKVDEHGNVDEAAAKAAIEAVLKDVPELKGSGAGNEIGGGTNTGGGHGGLSQEEAGRKLAEERMKTKTQSQGYNPWA